MRRIFVLCLTIIGGCRGTEEPEKIGRQEHAASSINASSINASSINASSINASSINASSINASSINASSINASSINASSINASSINSVLLEIPSATLMLNLNYTLNAVEERARARGYTVMQAIDATAPGSPLAPNAGDQAANLLASGLTVPPTSILGAPIVAHTDTSAPGWMGDGHMATDPPLTVGPGTGQIAAGTSITGYTFDQIDGFCPFTTIVNHTLPNGRSVNFTLAKGSTLYGQMVDLTPDGVGSAISEGGIDVDMNGEVDSFEQQQHILLGSVWWCSNLAVNALFIAPRSFTGSYRRNPVVDGYRPFESSDISHLCLKAINIDPLDTRDTAVPQWYCFAGVRAEGILGSARLEIDPQEVTVTDPETGEPSTYQYYGRTPPGSHIFVAPSLGFDDHGWAWDNTWLFRSGAGLAAVVTRNPLPDFTAAFLYWWNINPNDVDVALDPNAPDYATEYEKAEEAQYRLMLAAFAGKGSTPRKGINISVAQIISPPLSPQPGKLNSCEIVEPDTTPASAPASFLPDAASCAIVNPCPDGFTDGVDRDCGWVIGEVIACTAPITVAAGTNPAGGCAARPLGLATGNTMMRLCECPAGQPCRPCAHDSELMLAESDDECGTLNPGVANVPCPASGRVALLKANRDSDLTRYAAYDAPGGSVPALFAVDLPNSMSIPTSPTSTPAEGTGTVLDQCEGRFFSYPDGQPIWFDPATGYQIPYLDAPGGNPVRFVDADTLEPLDFVDPDTGLTYATWAPGLAEPANSIPAPGAVPPDADHPPPGGWVQQADPIARFGADDCGWRVHGFFALCTPGKSVEIGCGASDIFEGGGAVLSPIARMRACDGTTSCTNNSIANLGNAEGCHITFTCGATGVATLMLASYFPPPYALASVVPATGLNDSGTVFPASPDFLRTPHAVSTGRITNGNLVHVALPALSAIPPLLSSTTLPASYEKSCPWGHFWGKGEVEVLEVPSGRMRCYTNVVGENEGLITMSYGAESTYDRCPSDEPQFGAAACGPGEPRSLFVHMVGTVAAEDARTAFLVPTGGLEHDAFTGPEPDVYPPTTSEGTQDLEVTFDSGAPAEIRPVCVVAPGGVTDCRFTTECGRGWTFEVRYCDGPGCTLADAYVLAPGDVGWSHQSSDSYKTAVVNNADKYMVVDVRSNICGNFKDERGLERDAADLATLVPCPQDEPQAWSSFNPANPDCEATETSDIAPRDCPNPTFPDIDAEFANLAVSVDPITTPFPVPPDAPPTFTPVPSDIMAVATGPDGAKVKFDVQAEDELDGAVPVICEPASGTLFRTGTTTTVTCRAFDSFLHYTDPVSFLVKVTDLFLLVPSPVEQEAEGPQGAVVDFSDQLRAVRSWTDPVLERTVADPDACTFVLPGYPEHPPVAAEFMCDPPSGSLFPLGYNDVSCTVMDSYGNLLPADFQLLVSDHTAPTLQVPADLTVAPTSSAGAEVTFRVQASDLVGLRDVSCSISETQRLVYEENFDPPVTSSSTQITAAFPPGVSTVFCSSEDTSLNDASGSFTVTVSDANAAPIVHVPASFTVEADSAQGAHAVPFSVTAEDDHDAVTPSCTVETTCEATASGPAISSPADFPMGTTLVCCRATDSQGSTGLGSFTVTVQDTQAPVISVPADLVVAGTSEDGSVVSYTASATDAGDGPVPVSCTPPSGSLFAFGTTTVTCTAADASGHTASASFTVTVSSPSAWYCGIGSPINADGSSIFKLGRTVPVKFSLGCADSPHPTDVEARLYVTKISSGLTGTQLEAPSNVTPDSGSVFRYDAATDQYVYNLATDGLSPGTWQLTIAFSDGTQETAIISLRR